MESSAASCTVIPAAAQDLAMVPTVAARRALGLWLPMRTVSGWPLIAARAASGLATVN